MASVDVEFTRTLLTMIGPAVKAQGKRPMKDAWVYHFGRGQWEFHGPDKFYWYGRAANAYEARYKGWVAWLCKQGVEP